MKNEPSSIPQQKLIKELINKIPESKQTLEYQDYLENPTKNNASEFITETLANYSDIFEGIEKFVDYMAYRPSVEKISTHGLFSSENKPLDLEKVKKEVADHKGNIYLNVISLKREEAQRLCFDSFEPWRDLIRSKQALLAKNFKIPIEDLRWYAAFHNQSHHPHVHLMVFNANPYREYLSATAIDNLRHEFAHEIFADDLYHIYNERTEIRNELKNIANVDMKRIVDEINNQNFKNPKLEKMLINLGERLKIHKGKKAFGYLKPSDKKLVNEIVKELCNNEKINELYEKWWELQNQINSSYTDKTAKPTPLWEQKEFKSIKNVVISEALRISIEELKEDVEEDIIEVEFEIDTPKYETIKSKITIEKPKNNEEIIEDEEPNEVFKTKTSNPVKSNVTPTNAVTSLIKHLSKIISDDYQEKQNKLYRIDKKLYRKIAEKKQNQGIKLE